MTPELNDDPLLRDVPEIDGFKVLEPCVLFAAIGKGGMGAVYRGRHLNLDLDVAVKCLKASLAAEDPDFVVRFQREARVAAAVSAAQLIRVFDVGHRHGVHYLVMEFVDGENLQGRVDRKGPLDLAEALSLMIAASRGVAAAHERGVVHRDIKPANILVSRRGEVKIADLGLARAAEAIDSLATASQLVLGTPQYMPPEQFESAKSVGPEGDVHALAACLWFTLTGRNAIEPGSLAEIMRRVVLQPFPDLAAHRPDLPPSVLELVRWATEKDPAKRPADAGVFGAELERIARELGLAASLRDDAAGEKGGGQGLVSPPPSGATMVKIRTLIESGALRESAAARGEAPTVRAPGRAGPAEKAPTGPDRPADREDSTHEMPRFPQLLRGRSLPVLAALVLLLVGAAGSAVAWMRALRSGSDRVAAPAGAPAIEPARLVPGAGLTVYLGVHSLDAAFDAGRRAVVEAQRSRMIEDRPDFDSWGEFARDVFGMSIADRETATAVIDGSRGMAFAHYGATHCEFWTFHCRDLDRYRQLFTRYWSAQADIAVESRVDSGFSILEARNTQYDYKRAQVLIRGDQVWVTPGDRADRIIVLLGSGDPTTLADLGEYRRSSADLPADRLLSFFGRIDADELGRERDLALLLGRPGPVAGALRFVDGEIDLEMRLPLDKDSRLPSILAGGGLSMLGRYGVADAAFAFEAAISRPELFRYLEATAARADLDELFHEARESLGIDLERRILDHLDGRIGLVVSRESAGTWTLNTSSGDLVLDLDGRRMHPVVGSPDPDAESRRGNRMNGSLPQASLLLGLRGDPGDLLADFSTIIDKLARSNPDLELDLTRSGTTLRLRVGSRREDSHLDLELSVTDDVLSISLQGAAVRHFDDPFGEGSFGASDSAVLRASLDSEGIAKPLASVVGNSEFDLVRSAVDRRSESSDLEITQRDGELVGRWHVGRRRHWPTKASIWPRAIWGAILALGAGALLLLRRRGG